MVTEKLFYQDQYLGRFTANVMKADYDGSKQFYVVLDQTAFYPTGGGQPHDTGTLNDIEVYNVEEIDGELRHFLREPIPSGSECVGEINWERRMDHMQQHAGQHILTAAFEEELGYKTLSFHLGEELCSIDLATEFLTNDDAIEVEKIANLMIIENHPIETRWVTSEEIGHYKLRKELSVTDNIRLVIIPDFDYNGCGGTHPSSTGQVGSIQVLHWEKQKKHIRLYFVCGRRVRKQLHVKHQIIRSLTSKLSAPQEELVPAVNRLLEEMNEMERANTELRTKLLEYEINELMENLEEIRGYSILKNTYHNRSMTELQQLAKNIIAQSVGTIVLFINETADKLQVVCARGNELPISMNQLLKQALPIVNGKGGGNDLIAQGGGEKLMPSVDFMNHIHEVVVESLMNDIENS
ncbi:alanyl-tRNA editing protein [Ornithinibacillus scapharcae]|uniref:alanyl-tRNA editing protein n=1 Tax=Ornithinibacillus scapharcae TaxID=1147159 RepID=UPI000225BACC|nr:DHHA1 domain-containing protein [Ornithinibacillus scapharcae]